MKFEKKCFLIGMAAVMSVSCISGCKDKDVSGGESKLTYWSPFYPHYSNMGESRGDAPFFKELSKRTGVQIEFIHPPAGNEAENFNLMVSSGDLPDLIEYSFLSYKGGPEKALDDNIIKEITKEEMKSKAPNLAKVLLEHPQWDKQVKTDSGKYYCFPAIRGDESLDYWRGMQIRKDYLDKIGMEAPETIEEWEKVLTAFKEQLNIENPLTFLSSDKNKNNYLSFVGAYGITNSFFLKDGKVIFGPMTDEYGEFISLFNRWAEKGLIDPDYATQDGKTMDAKIASGRAGAYEGSAGGDMGRHIAATKANDPTAELMAVKPPVLKKGDEPKIGFKDFDYIPTQSIHISTNCKNIDAAFKLLDYGYGEEGHMYFNFGVEGTSYNMIDGYPTFVDSIIHPTDGTAVSNTIAEYALSSVLGPMVQDARYFEQYMVNPEQRMTAEMWKLAGDASWRMPNVTYTLEEARDISSKLNEIDSYRTEMEAKFILGREPLSNLSKYRQTLKDMGLEEVIKVMQAAVERYESR